MPAVPPDPQRPSIRALAAAAVEASPGLAANPLLDFLRKMTPEQEEVAEHLLQRDRDEIEAEIQRLRAEESAA